MTAQNHHSTAGRTIAIGDVHGCSTALAALLSEIGPGEDDCLVLLGDFIDRGPDSRGVLQRLLELQRSCRLVLLLGNHEEMLLRARGKKDPAALHNWLSHGGAATLNSYGFGIGPDGLPEEHVALIEGCRPYYETGTHIFVHANYDANSPMEQQSPQVLYWQPLRDRMPVRHFSGKTVVVGHSPKPDGEILDRGYLKCIDTHCYAGGWLTALDIGCGKLWQADQQGRARSSSGS